MQDSRKQAIAKYKSYVHCVRYRPINVGVIIAVSVMSYVIIFGMIWDYVRLGLAVAISLIPSGFLLIFGLGTIAIIEYTKKLASYGVTPHNLDEEVEMEMSTLRDLQDKEFPLRLERYGELSLYYFTDARMKNRLELYFSSIQEAIDYREYIKTQVDIYTTDINMVDFAQWKKRYQKFKEKSGENHPSVVPLDESM